MKEVEITITGEDLVIAHQVANNLGISVDRAIQLVAHEAIKKGANKTLESHLSEACHKIAKIFTDLGNQVEQERLCVPCFLRKEKE